MMSQNHRPGNSTAFSGFAAAMDFGFMFLYLQAQANYGIYLALVFF